MIMADEGQCMTADSQTGGDILDSTGTTLYVGKGSFQKKF